MRTPDELRELVEAYLRRPEHWQTDAPTGWARRFATRSTGGGKRLRPVLCLAVGEAVGVDAERLLPAAAALELIHTFSLVHDDLPALDDDDERRGRASAHVRYGEGVAILAGDALLTKAFALAATYDRPGPAAVLAEATLGMIEGQYLDITAADVEVLELHRLKTAQLFAAARAAPAGPRRARRTRTTGRRSARRSAASSSSSTISWTATAPSSATALRARASSPPTRPRSRAARSAAWTRTRACRTPCSTTSPSWPNEPNAPCPRPRRPRPTLYPVKKRLDVLLVERGLAASRAQAQALVMAGRVPGHAKAGEQVDEDADVVVEAPPRFVSRAGEKLEHALERARSRRPRPRLPRRRRVHRRLHGLPAPARRSARDRARRRPRPARRRGFATTRA